MRNVLFRLMMAFWAVVGVTGCAAVIGQFSAGPTEPIADVQVVSPATFPYVAQIQAQQGPNYRACTGTLVSRRWILTAGHCLVNPRTDKVFPSSAYRVQLGSGSEYRVVATKLHPRYVLDAKHTRANDLAMLKLAGEAVEKPLPLAAELPPAGAEAMMAGWGCLDRSLKTCKLKPEGLKTATVSFVYTDACGLLADGEVCSVRPGKTSVVRSGDSGGPMIMSTDDGKRLAAVISGSNERGEVSMTLPLGWIRAVSGVSAPA